MGIDKNQLAALTSYFQTQYGMTASQASNSAKAAMNANNGSKLMK